VVHLNIKNGRRYCITTMILFPKLSITMTPASNKALQPTVNPLRGLSAAEFGR